MPKKTGGLWEVVKVAFAATTGSLVSMLLFAGIGAIFLYAGMRQLASKDKDGIPDGNRPLGFLLSAIGVVLLLPFIGQGLGYAFGSGIWDELS